jgi:uncharacterized membrane protein YdcZ (DUF606 family)
VQTVYIAIAVAIGAGAGTQLAMLGAVSRQRGSFEAVWITVLGTLAGAATFLAVRALRGDEPLLPSPFDRASLFVVVAVVTAVALLASVRELDLYFAVMGFFGLALVLGAAFLGPRIGVALFVSAMIAGQMVTALLLDHVGAFGATEVRASLMRVAGAGALILGVALVRGGD